MKETAKIISAKQGMANMAIYLHQALKEAGYTNPKAEMIKGISDTLKLLPEEKYYIYDTNPSVDAKGVCDNIVEMIKSMEKNNKIDIVDLRQIEQSIIALKTLIKK